MESEAPYKTHHSDNGNCGTPPEYEVYETVAVAHIGWIYNIARRQLRDTALAEDAAQAVLLALWQKRRYIFNRNRPIGGWLAQATYYACSEIRKSERRRKNRERKAAAMRHEEMQGSASTAAEESNLEQLLAMDAALQRLSTGDRDVLVARYFQNQTARQMAQAFNISEAAAEKRITRAVINLRGIMAHKNIVMDSTALAALLSSGAGTAPNGLLAKVLQGISDKAPVSLTAAHAARSIAFHSAHIPAIVGAAAVALAVSVAAVAPMAIKARLSSATPVPAEITPSQQVAAANSTAAQSGVLTCVAYEMLVQRDFAWAIKTGGKLLTGKPGGVKAYDISARVVRALARTEAPREEVILGGGLHWLTTSAQATLREDSHSIEMYENYFATIGGVRGVVNSELNYQWKLRAIPHALRLHVSFLPGSRFWIQPPGPVRNIHVEYRGVHNIRPGKTLLLLTRLTADRKANWYSAIVFDVERYPPLPHAIRASSAASRYKGERAASAYYLPITLGTIADLSDYIRIGPAALEREMAVALAWDIYALKHPKKPQADNSRWTRTTPSGVSLTLRSVSTGAWPLCQWTPGGSPTPGSWNFPGYLASGQMRAIFGIRVPGKGARSIPRWLRRAHHPDTPLYEAGNGVSGSVPVGVDGGKWKIISPAKWTFRPRRNFSYMGARFGLDQIQSRSANQASHLPASLLLTLATPEQAKALANQAIAVGVIDRGGKLVPPEPGFLPVPYGPFGVQSSRSEAVGEYRHETIEASINDVKRYVWITRPRYWVTFRGFALKPSPLPSVVFAMSEHGQEKSSALGTPTTAPSGAAKKAAVVTGRATPAELCVLMEHYLQQGTFNAMNQLYWAPTALDKRVAKQANNAMVAMFGFGLWPVAKKRFGAAQLAAAKITKVQLGWPGGSQKTSTPIRWKITGRFAAPVQTLGQIVVVGIGASAHAPLIREHGLWYINFGVTSAKMRQVKAKLKEFKKYYSHTGAYKAVLTELQAGKIKDAYALRDALAAALKKYSKAGK